jgi:hypothetical protein
MIAATLYCLQLSYFRFQYHERYCKLVVSHLSTHTSKIKYTGKMHVVFLFDYLIKCSFFRLWFGRPLWVQWLTYCPLIAVIRYAMLLFVLFFKL